MSRKVRPITSGAAVLLLACASVAHAQIPIRVTDVRPLEGSSGNHVITVPVTISGPPPTAITVDWTLVEGSATSGSDFSMASGTLTFPALSGASQNISVTINGDGGNEWSATSMQDEVFFVQLSNVSSGGAIDKGRGTVTLIDDDRLRPGVQFLTAVSTGTSVSGQNKLQWRIPGAQIGAINVEIAWKQGAGCTFPLSDTDTAGGGLVVVGSAAAQGAVQTFAHTGRGIGVPHCYSVFAVYASGITAEIAKVKATPIDTTGSILWSYASGAASVVPPSIGADAIYTTDNLGVVHAMKRGGTGGGDWPSTWNPLAVGKPTQNRSAVIPVSTGSRLLLGTDGGGVHGVDGRTGTLVWSRSSAFGSALPSLGGVQAQPAALLKSFGGNNDMLLVGTNNGASNTFHALDLATGNTQDAPYPSGLMGNVMGQAVVDYAFNRVLFLTSNSSGTVFGLDLGVAGTPKLTLATLPGGNPIAFGGSSGAAVLRSNRLLFGDNNGKLWSLDLASGVSYSQATGEGNVKGFVWPDRRDDRIYVSCDDEVLGFRDTGSALVGPLWNVSLTTPSMVLQKPGTDFIYVGDGQGNLVQIDVSDHSKTQLMLENGAQIGAPSLDGPNSIVIVGSATGTIYGVRVPY
jgi:PQQ-like domain/Calx-beta domain